MPRHCCAQRRQAAASWRNLRLGNVRDQQVLPDRQPQRAGAAPLSDVEELLAERGLDISYESIPSWVLKFGPAIARPRTKLAKAAHCLFEGTRAAIVAPRDNRQDRRMAITSSAIRSTAVTPGARRRCTQGCVPLPDSSGRCGKVQ